MPRTLAQWLDWQQSLHGRGIDLGLDRVHAVWLVLGHPRPAPLVITVGGTNGKGSTVALLESMLRRAGLCVGSYTSPHLVRYNERVRINGVEAEDEAFISAFERIEAVRADITLTWFEYGTLAAFLMLAEAGLDVAILEVGLGGRLDAVNLIDADCAIVTSIGLDHMDYLGPDRESIGYEKAGIFRSGRPAICAELDAPVSLVAHATAIGADLRRIGRDFGIEARDDALHWWARDRSLELPLPTMSAPCQPGNVAAALAAIDSLEPRIAWAPQAWREGVRRAHVRARLERVSERPEVIVDVAHNPHAASVLARWMRESHRPGTREIAVFSALQDKDIEGMWQLLDQAFEQWWITGLADQNPRGLTLEQLALRLAAAGLAASRMRCFATVDEALRAVDTELVVEARVLVFGSFHTAACALEHYGASRA